jgi:uncharacterized membrane protein YbhN (UPF0104 family)
MSASSDSVTVAPDPHILAWVAFSSIFIIVSAVCLVICVLKGRWGFALLGFFTVGLFAIVGSFLSPVPGSVWAKRASRNTSFGRALT